ncbi:MAG: NUDIX domain-containing protein [Alphaproteobacteria bacterium]|nr:NUDIX domain-containing protein [Alphaproteobacteria bacterium]MBN2779675.1 NUDIX domain-containing protein [Alphaproteobacteria bacterium]
MDIIQTFQNHPPYDENEKHYKESCLQFLKNFPKELWGVRENLIGHLTPTAWVINKNRDKALMAFHNIYQSWAWLGGHSDGDLDLLHVAKKEVMEESGLKKEAFHPVFETPFDLNIVVVAPHIKHGKFIPDHIHINPVFLFEANENASIQHLPEENSGIEWIPVNDILNRVSEEHLKPTYQRIMDKVKKLNE